MHAEIGMTALNMSVPTYVAGHRGMMGSAIVRRLKERGYGNLLTGSLEPTNAGNNQKPSSTVLK